MQILNFIVAVFWLFLVLYGVYYLYLFILRKTSATMVDEAAIQENIRRVQVVDVRESADFDAKHILGARNIPISQFKERHHELRRDTPIYLYDDALNFASRAAHTLKKSGYTNIHILKGGFSRWTGKTKSNR
ncbi:MAG: rhodanese-like domain-containing protein [Aerococcaceae bacterium]|nr:rhodanese-like domain-containing protein [Aerococcaceae bacterium]